MTLRDEILADIEAPHRRRVVAALTDIRQTHLTERDAKRDWGGSRGK